jgi:hypothetical protein
MQRTMRHRVFTCALVFFLALVASGCASVDPKPFATFSESLQELRKGSDAALGLNDEQNRTRFLDVAVRKTAPGGDPELVGNLMMDRDPPFGWTMNEPPLFLESRRFRAAVRMINEALVSYAGLLADLAAPELVDPAQFDQMAKDLNGNLKSAGKRLGQEGHDRELALFSLAASKAAHAAIENKRQGHLKDVLKETQPGINSVAEALQAAMRTAAQNLEQNYLQGFEATAELIPGANVAKRRASLDQLLRGNELYSDRLEALATLDHAYGNLPAAHRELLEAIQKPGLNMTAVNNLYDSGKHLYSLYEEMAAAQPKP